MAPSSVPATRRLGFLAGEQGEDAAPAAAAEDARNASAETLVLLLLLAAPPPGAEGTLITTLCLSEKASLSAS